MSMRVYYNEIDPAAAAWLRELVRAGHLPDGDVDERDIRDIVPSELSGYGQCHFFAGIGGWAYALRLAGWPDDRPVWTGSCPCQPFSAAGRRAGVADERHLWPHWHHLIRECRPSVVFGEQVASSDGLGWLDLVCADMEATGYAVGAADLCAAGVGAPHIRQRLWFVAERLADAKRDEQRRGGGAGREGQPGSEPRSEPRGCGEAGGLADASADGSQGRLRGRPDTGRETVDGSAGRDGADFGLADPSSAGWTQRGLRDGREFHGGASETRGEGREQADRDVGHHEDVDMAGRPATRPTDGFWRDADWLFCRDERFRPVEPGTFPLADGLPARVGRLRGYGNAIVPQVAATFIRAVM